MASTAGLVRRPGKRGVTTSGRRQRGKEAEMGLLHRDDWYDARAAGSVVATTHARCTGRGGGASMARDRWTPQVGEESMADRSTRRQWVLFRTITA